MNLLAVACRVRSDLGSFLPRAARAFEVLTNLLAPGTGSVEVFLCISVQSVEALHSLPVGLEGFDMALLMA